MHKTPPYNTGKVLIGSRYEPPSRIEFSRDAEHLQAALLGIKEPRITPIVARALVWGSIFVAVVFLLTAWRDR